MTGDDKDLAAARHYGEGDASYQAAGAREGIGQLVHRFYEHMDALAEARTIREMHAPDLALVREKLAVFLCAWLGGPNQYRERFGAISIPGFHARFPIDAAARDAWLSCMARAVEEQPWAESFKTYFMRAVALPAERVRVASEMRRAGS